MTNCDALGGRSTPGTTTTRGSARGGARDRRGDLARPPRPLRERPPHRRAGARPARRELLGVRAGAVTGAVVVGGALALAACGDLFHGTSDFETLCEVDAAACSGPSASGGDASPFPADFCQWDAATARANATRACAWLGACAGPLGDNAFGECLVHATLAYDCAANPNRPVLGAAHAFWDGLWRASSCADVTAVVEPASPRGACGASSFAYVACEVGGNAGTRLACAEGSGGADGERASFVGRGQIYAAVGTSSSCTELPSAPAETRGNLLRRNEAARLRQRRWPGSRRRLRELRRRGVREPRGLRRARGAAMRSTSTTIACNGDVVSGCPSGTLHGAGSITMRPPGDRRRPWPPQDGRTWEVARGCTLGACGADSCSGNVLTSCARGADVQLDCAQAGLGACKLVSLPGDPSPHAVCSSP